MTHLLHRMDRSIHYVLPFLLFFLLAFNGLPAQGDLTPDQRSAVRAIANYTKTVWVK